MFALHIFSLLSVLQTSQHLAETVVGVFPPTYYPAPMRSELFALFHTTCMSLPGCRQKGLARGRYTSVCNPFFSPFQKYLHSCSIWLHYPFLRPPLYELCPLFFAHTVTFTLGFPCPDKVMIGVSRSVGGNPNCSAYPPHLI